MTKKLGGIIIPSVTPFEEDGSLSFEKAAKNIEKWNKTGISGLMVLGTNGEFKALSDDESFEVIKFFSERISPEKILIAGVGRESLYLTEKFIDRLAQAKLKIDYVSVLPPHYFAKLMTDEALINYYTKLADKSPYPVLMYCAPSYSNNVCLSVDVVKKLADHPNILGIKDTSSNMMEAYMNAFSGRDDFEVLAGSLNNIMTCLKMGGHGGVISASNYFPEECAHIMELFEKEGFDKALSYHTAIKELSKKTGASGGVAGVKACMNAVGYEGGLPRLPILPLSDEKIEEMKIIIKNSKEK